MVVLIELLVFSVTFVLLKTILNGRRKSNISYPPSIPALPLVGSLPFFRNVQHLPRFFMKKAEELGPIFTFKIGSSQCLLLNSYEAIEEALVKNSSSYAGRKITATEAYLNDETNKGIVSHNFDVHFKHHQKLTLSILREFGFGIKHIMEQRISTEVTDVIAIIKEKQGKQFDPADLVLQASSNVILSILYARKEPYENGLCKLIRTSLEATESVNMLVEFAPWLRFFPYFRAKIQESVRMINEMMSLYEEEVKYIEEGNSGPCFVSKYLEKEGPDCDRKQLLCTVRDLTLGGTDTTATTLLWTLSFLANHQDVQAKLHKEIDEAVPRSRLPSLQDKQNLPYLEATIFEVLRMKTLIPLALPHLTLKDTEISGYFVPEGTMVFPNLYAVHMDTIHWKDPETFRPERFLDKDNNIINKDKFIPFSLGRRSCLGEVLARHELFQFISGLVQNFRFLPPENQDKVEVKDCVKFVLKPTPFQVRMISRIG